MKTHHIVMSACAISFITLCTFYPLNVEAKNIRAKPVITHERKITKPVPPQYYGNITLRTTTLKNVVECLPANVLLAALTPAKRNALSIKLPLHHHH